MTKVDVIDKIEIDIEEEVRVLGKDGLEVERVVGEEIIGIGKVG